MLVNIALLFTLATYSTSSPAVGLNLNRYKRALNLCFHCVYTDLGLFSSFQAISFTRQKYPFCKKKIPSIDLEVFVWVQKYVLKH